MLNKYATTVSMYMCKHAFMYVLYAHNYIANYYSRYTYMCVISHIFYFSISRGSKK